MDDGFELLDWNPERSPRDDASEAELTDRIRTTSLHPAAVDYKERATLLRKIQENLPGLAAPGEMRKVELTAS